MSESESRLYKTLLLAFLLLALLVFFWGLGSIGLMSFNEARRALPAQAMFLGGDWLLPHLNGELYLTKPPLLYWLAAIAAHIAGATSEWAVRLPSALAAAATLAMVYMYARRQFGAWPALFSAQILIANVTFAMFARRAEIEMLLTALCVASLLAAIHYIREGANRRWIYLSYFLLGLAVLTKGPLALLFVTLPLLLVAIYQRDARCWQVLGSPLGWLIFVAVGLSWYIAVSWRMGPEIWSAIVHKDMLGKIQDEATAKPLLSYLLWLLVDFLPVVLLFFIRPKTIWEKLKGRTDTLILLAAILVPLVIFSLISNKHAKYLLPIYPLLALLLGMHLGRFFELAGLRTKRLILAVGVLLPLLYAGYYAIAEARIYDYRVSAFPQFSNWSGLPQAAPLYAYKDADERLFYYSARHIAVIDEAAYRQLRDSHAAMLLLADSKNLPTVRPQAGCVIKEFKPYLKKDETLTVLGFGAACASQ